MVAHGRDLGAVLLDATVARDDQPAPLGDLRDPNVVRRVRLRDDARWPLASVNNVARITGIGHIAAQADENLRETEDVRVAVEPDNRELDLRHAVAWSAFS